MRRAALLLFLFAGAINAGGPLFSSILGGSGQDYATAVTTDPAGNIYVAGLTYSPDFKVTAGAAQTKFGGTCDAFVAKVSPDGKLIWSTYLGGILDDWATGIALDGAGSVLVAGHTRSPNFPLVNTVQSVLNNSAALTDYDAFVAKLDPNGAKILYSTFLGGGLDDGADGIVADAAGNAYVAVSVGSAAGFPGVQSTNQPSTNPQGGIVVSKLNPQGELTYSFFHPFGTAAAITIDAEGNAYVAGTAYGFNPSTATQSFGPRGGRQAMAFKVSPDGSKKIFEVALGGSFQTDASAIAVNSAGQIHLAGSTSSADFPLVRPLQSSPGSRPLWRSADSGTTWSPMDDLPFAVPQALVVDPSSPNTVYAATGDLGVFKSVDGGATWARASNGIAGSSIAGSNIQALAIDPVHPQTLYAATGSSNGTAPNTIYKTVNGAASWAQIDSAPCCVSRIAVDAQNPDIVYQVARTLRKSSDGGATWNPVTFPGTVQAAVLDPRVSGTIYAISEFVFCGFFCNNNSTPTFYRSVDGGGSWIELKSPAPTGSPLFVDGTTNPSTLYAGLFTRSVDGGVTWTPVNPPPGGAGNTAAVAVDPSGAFYASVYGTGMFVSRDHAQTWTAIGSPVPQRPSAAGAGPGVISIVPAGGSGNLFTAINQISSSGFVTKLSADGASLVYSTYLRGHPSPEPYFIFAAEPLDLITQNWIAAVALDAAGNAVVAGGTRAADLPVALPARATNTGLADAFVATIAADGSTLNNSTYFGGTQDDGALAIALDSQGNVILAGQTWSPDFPLPGPVSQPTGFGEAFLMKLAPPGPPAIRAVLNGASFQPGIAAGSWVTIEGVNLSNTYPGRTWRDEEVINGNLPASLDGVRVTINGKPAYVYFISPTQINVQAPSDTTVGRVDVVVENNGAIGAPATAQLQAAAPGFFTYGGTRYAIASRLPDYALLSDPSTVAGTTAAKPGDTVVLWGTGFGATNPAAPAGVAVSGTPAVVTPPVVTVGGVSVPVVSTVLTTGTAGLYQLTIQMPASTPAGAVSVQASFGGVATQAGAMLFVGK